MSDLTDEDLDQRAVALDEKRKMIQELKASNHDAAIEDGRALRASQLDAEEARLDREIEEQQNLAAIREAFPQGATTQEAKENMRRMMEHVALQKKVNKAAGVSASDATVIKQVAEDLQIDLDPEDIKYIDSLDTSDEIPDPTLDLPPRRAPHKAASAKAKTSDADDYDDKKGE